MNIAAKMRVQALSRGTQSNSTITINTSSRSFERLFLSPVMITLPEIPVEISPSRLADLVGLAEEEVKSFLNEAHGLLKPAGAFDEVDPVEALGSVAGKDAREWGPRVIIGLCALGEAVAHRILETKPLSALWPGLSRLALRDALDYLEYRVRLFLRPAGLEPCDLLVPGCQDLPLTANQAILRHFSPELSSGLTVSPEDEIDSLVGFAFLYTTAARSEKAESRCANCSRSDCPVRN
ncbi:MAG: hypothetical protein JRG97_07190 [Deltaproteobacteria bacterium]|nr:hypothetical protein [Deltaproteobacteria bacterium]MBW2140842.1 hypothetical protein [Deltaproteobacteria bacterium]